MAAISFGGLGNGLDFGQVVTELVNVQRQPIDALNQKKQNLQSKVSDYGLLGTKLLALQSAADTLRLSTSFDQNQATVSDDNILTATSTTTAGAGSYSIQVTQLAQAHQITNKAAKAVGSTSTAIVSGGSATFTFKVGTGSNQMVTLSDGATLEDLRSAINDLGAGVTASIINTGTESSPAYRLTLTATSPGASNVISIVTDSTALDLTNSSGTGGADTLQSAKNATLVVGSPGDTTITIQRESNVVTDAIPDVTLTLKGTTSGTPVNVNVARDPGKVQENIKALVTAYNDIVKFINERTTYDTTTKQGGIFFNESTAKSVLSSLRSALSGEVSGTSTYTSVGQIGFKTERDGTITVDEGKLSTALSTNYTAVRSLFLNQTTITGVAQRVTSAVDLLDDVEHGSFTIRKNALNDQISKLSDDIARKEDESSRYEERLRLQFAQLDSLLSQLKSQSNFLQSRLGSA
jgi:flagellar hook-associated protein 2